MHTQRHIHTHMHTCRLTCLHTYSHTHEQGLYTITSHPVPGMNSLALCAVSQLWDMLCPGNLTGNTLIKMLLPYAITYLGPLHTSVRFLLPHFLQ